MRRQFQYLIVVAVTGLWACGEDSNRSTTSDTSDDAQMPGSDSAGGGASMQSDIGTNEQSSDGGVPGDASTLPTRSPFVGTFDCTFTAESFTGGGQSSGPANTFMTLIGTERPNNTVHWQSPGTRENLFQGCGTIMAVMGREATLVGGDNCEISLTEGSATASDDNHFSGNFDGTFGLDIKVNISCERRPENGPDAFPNGFIGDWACNGETTQTFGGMSMMGNAQFGLKLMRIEDGILSVKQWSGDGTIFAFCPAYFEATSATFAELHERSDCDTIRGTPLMSQGITLQGDSLSGDYGSEMPQVTAHLQFTCTR